MGFWGLFGNRAKTVENNWVKLIGETMDDVKPLGAINANTPFRQPGVLNFMGNNISSNFRISSNEVAGRKMTHNAGINAQISQQKQRLKDVDALSDHMKGLGFPEKAIDRYRGEVGNEIEYLKSRRRTKLGIATDYLAGSGNLQNTAVRAGTAAGLYGAGALGIRSLQGGNPWTDPEGNRDIAGIPFV